MSKRSNPYSDDFIPQSKTHVGLKQFNNNEDRLKKVYEKTLELLFRGAKKGQQNLIQNSTNNSAEKKDGMKQLFIGKDGALLHSGNISVEKNPSVKHCDNCVGAVKSESCAYCETALCPTCQHHCGVCEQPYCFKCSLIGSEGTEVCVSCYS